MIKFDIFILIRVDLYVEVSIFSQFEGFHFSRLCSAYLKLWQLCARSFFDEMSFWLQNSDLQVLRQLWANSEPFCSIFLKKETAYSSAHLTSFNHAKHTSHMCKALLLGSDKNLSGETFHAILLLSASMTSSFWNSYEFKWKNLFVKNISHV